MKYRSNVHESIARVKTSSHITTPLWCKVCDTLSSNKTRCCRRTWSKLVHVMTCRLLDAKPFPAPLVTHCQLDPLGINFSEIWMKILIFFPGQASENICKMSNISFQATGDMAGWVISVMSCYINSSARVTPYVDIHLLDRQWLR